MWTFEFLANGEFCSSRPNQVCQIWQQLHFLVSKQQLHRWWYYRKRHISPYYSQRLHSSIKTLINNRIVKFDLNLIGCMYTIIWSKSSTYSRQQCFPDLISWSFLILILCFILNIRKWFKILFQNTGFSDKFPMWFSFSIHDVEVLGLF